MTVAFFPASRDLSHASSRIRALSVGKWLSESGDVPISWNDPHADVAVVFKRPELVERMKLGRKRVIFDISDDYTWSDEHRRAYRSADIIVAGTMVLAQRVRVHNDKIVHIPDCIDPVSSAKAKWRGPWQDNFRHILWFGCWGSKHHDTGGMRDILSIKDELNSFDDLALTICSNSRELFQRVSGELSIPTAYEEWDRNTFGSLLRRHHAVIIPVVDTPYTRAKSHNRVTTAIAAGVPVIASNMPAYLPFGVTTTDWREALAGPWKTADAQLLEPYAIDWIGEKWKDLLCRAEGRHAPGEGQREATPAAPIVV